MSTTDWVGLALESALKGAVILSAAMAVVTLMRRASAAARHFVLAGVMLCAAAVVPVGQLLPSWQIAVLPPISAEARAPRTLGPVGSEIAPAGVTVAPPVLDPQSAFIGGGPLVSPPRAPWWAAISGLSLGVKVLVLWLAGAIVVLAGYLVGVLGVARLQRGSVVVTDRRHLALVRELSDSLGLARHVTLRTSGRSDMPVTWGTMRPTILMPAESSAWSDARLRAVLHHELAHVARRDCAWHLVSTVACAVHWFNPVVWMAARRLRAERERACDDLVVAGGTDPCEYADHLLAVAREFHAPRGTAALAMARPSQLEGRLLSILDASAPRRAPSAGRRAMMALAIGVLVLPTAAMRPWRAAAEPGAHAVATHPTATEARIAPLGPLPPLPAITDTLRWTRRMSPGQWLRVYTMKSAVQIESSPDSDVHVVTIFGAADGRGPRQYEVDEDERQIEVCPALPSSVPRVPVSGCWPVDWKGEVERDIAVRTIVQVPDDILVDIKTSTGHIVATDARTRIAAGSERGSIRLTSAAIASANTVSGDVDVRFTRATWSGTTSLKSVSGRITVRMPSDADADVEVMTSTGRAQTSFALDRVWRGPQWRFHGSTQLGRGGRKLSVETWTGTIVVTREGESDLLPMRAARGEFATDTNSAAAANPSPRARVRPGTPVPMSEAALGAYRYDELPAQYDSLIDKAYRASSGGVTGERVALDLRGGFLRAFDRAALRGKPDSAALSHLAHLATARWLAYRLGAEDPGVELAGERALWALSRLTGGALLPTLARELTGPDWRARAYAAWTIGELRDARGSEALIGALRDQQWRVRAAAASAVASLAPRQALTPLLEMMRDPQHQVRAAVVEALAALDEPAARAAVRVALTDSHAMVRGQAESVTGSRVSRR